MPTYLFLSKQSQRTKLEELLYNLITDNHGTLRYATSHLTDRGLFQTTLDTGFPNMTAYTHVEQALEKYDLLGKVDETMMQILIVEELTRLDKRNKLEFVEENEEAIREKRIDHNMPPIEW